MNEPTTSQDPAATTSRLLVLMFTDLVGSTGLKSALTTSHYLPLLTRHDDLLRKAVASGNGRLQQDTGDGCFAVFATASDAVRAALMFQALMNAEPSAEDRKLVSRVGIHSGEVAETEAKQDGGNKIVGLAADLAARVMSLAQGGQILISRSAFNDARQFVSAHPSDAKATLQWMTHGPYLFKGSDEPMEISEVGVEGQSPLVPPPDSEKARRALRPGEEETMGWRPAVGKALEGTPQWVVEKKLGEGGFGEVWLARHNKAKSVRVFKFCFDADRLRALKREVVLFRLLKEALGDRRDIAAVKEWQFDKPPYFIELEFTPAGNMADWAEQQGGIEKIPLEKRLKIVAGMARALSAAHSVGILHKDIKPSNILMVEDAEGVFYPRLTDFGIGILTDRSRLSDFKITAAGFTASNISMNESSRTGTRMYTPPESLADKPHTVQGDVYALGVVLYQMVVGDLARPLGMGWERNVEDELLREDIAVCVDGDPARRLSSAEALAMRLESLEARRLELREKAKRADIERLGKRRRAQVRALTAALFVLAAISSAILFLWRDASTQRKKAEVAAQSERQQRERAEIEANNARRSDYFNRIALADSQIRENNLGGAHRLLSECPADLRGWEWGWLKRDSDRSLSTLRGHEDQVNSVAFSPDGTRIASTSSDKTIKVWDSKTGAELLTLRGHDAVVSSALFSPDGTRIVSASSDKTIKLWDAKSGKELQTLRGHEGWVNSAAFSADGTRIISASSDKTIKLWDAKSGKELQTLRGHDGGVSSAAFSADGTRIVSSSWDKTIKVWDAASGNELRTLRGHEAWVYSAAFSPDGTRIVSAGIDMVVKVWDSESGKELQTLGGHGEAIYSVAFNSDGSRIASASRDKTVKVWDVASGKELLTLRGHEESVDAVAFSPDGARIASGGSDRTVKIWDAISSKDALVLRPRMPIYAMAFSRDGSRIVSGGLDTSLKIWDATTGKELRTLDGHEKPVESVAFSPDGTRILSGSDDKTLRIWDVSSGKEIQTLRGHDEAVRTVAFSTDGARIVSGSDDKTIKVWDATSGKELQTLRGHEDLIGSVALSADGTRIISASNDKMIKVWDAASGKELLTLHGHGDSIRSVAISADGARIVSAGSDKMIKVWDATSGKELLTLRGHEDAVGSVAFSPDGTRIVSGSADKTLKVWDAKSGRELLTLHGHPAGISSVAFTADGTRIGSSGWDGTLRVWDSREVK